MKYLFCLLLALSYDTFADDTSYKRDFGLYVGAGGGSVDVDAIDAFSKDVSFKAGEVLGGVYWRWIGLEARAGQSLEDETIQIGRNPNTGTAIVAKTSIESYNAYYLRLQLENDIARIYALYGTSDISTTSVFEDGSIVEGNSSGDSYGLGAGVYVNPRMNFNFEVKYLLNSENESFLMTGFNIDFRI